ncbi:MAG: GNAT family N-acetyltransferase [Lachnotalea sp.]
MELIRITKENLEQEHICCAISNNNDVQVTSKKTWLEKRFNEGLVFLKGDVRGKCFIEYILAENAWAPIEASGYLYIDCFWVSGQYKGHGYSNKLLNACIEDAKQQGKKGLVILSSNKKMPFLSDPKYLKHKGFETVDFAMPYYELMCLKFEAIQIESVMQAQMAPASFTTYSLFYNGEFVTNEILSGKKFDKMITDMIQ